MSCWIYFSISNRESETSSDWQNGDSDLQTPYTCHAELVSASQKENLKLVQIDKIGIQIQKPNTCQSEFNTSPQWNRESETSSDWQH